MWIEIDLLYQSSYQRPKGKDDGNDHFHRVIPYAVVLEVLA